MPRKQQFVLIATSGLLSVGLFVATGPTIAQPTIAQPATAQPPEVVTVTAPRVVHQTVGRSNIGAPIEVTSISREVKFADSDLSTESGTAAIKERIGDIARDMCEELDKMYPLEQRDTSCARNATNDAMKQVDKIRGAYGTRQ